MTDFRERPSKETIKQAIQATVLERFSEGNVLRVDVDFESADEDDVIVVKVIFDASSIRLNRENAASLGRELREALSRIHESGFPLLRFISKNDVEGKAA